MRIGIFTDYFTPRADGTAIAVQMMRDELIKLGHEVYVFCPSRPGAAPQKRVIRLASIGLSFYDGLRTTFPYRRKYYEQVKRLNLDIIHIHTPAPVGLFGLRAAKKFKLPVAMSFHLDMDFIVKYWISAPGVPLLAFMVATITGNFRPIARILFGHHQAWRVMAFLASQCDLAIMPSQKMYRRLAAFTTDDNFLLLPNAVSLKGFNILDKKSARAKLGIPPDAKVAVTTSRLVKEKRIDLVISSFAKVGGRAKLIIVGDGPERRNLARLVKELGLNERVGFAGLVPRPKVFDYLAAADVYINACLYEVASLSILEAAAVGKPLLLFDKNLVEPLADGQNGYFVKNQKDLSRKIAKLFASPKLVVKLGQASKARAAKYNPSTETKKLVEAYQKIIGRR